MLGSVGVSSVLVRAVALLCLVASAGCSKMGVELDEPKPVPFEVQVNVTSDPGVPLAEAQILHGTKVVGTTAPTGSTTLKFGGAEGDQIDLTIKCPADYESPSKPLTVSLRRFAPGSPPPKFETRCPPAVRTMVVGLRAENGPNLPVTYLGRTVARTDGSGAALFVVHVKPSEPVEITLSTSESGAEMLRPQNPTLTFVAKDKDDYVVLDQNFTVLKKAAPVIHRNIPTPI
jgi:hypothetical protein